MTSALRPSLLALAAATALYGAGCSCEPGTVGGDPCTSDDECDTGESCVDDRCQTTVPPGDGGNESPTDIISLTIAPVDPVIVLPDDPATLTFTVEAMQRDGTPRPLTSGIVFTLDNVAIGTLHPSTGVFTAAGVGGVATVTVRLSGGSGPSASTSLTVTFHGEVFGMGVSPTDIAVFDGATPVADPTMSPGVDYPLAHAVMPRNVYPPNVMWTRHHPSPAAEDLWHVRLTRPHATLDGYFRADPAFTDNWQLPTDLWPAMAGSDISEPIEVLVEVASAGMLYRSEALEFRTVDGVLGGSVYYWSPPAARLRRIDVQTAALVDFLPTPGDDCIGCHSVSRDGQRLMAVREPTETVTAFDITRDLTANPAPNLFAVRYDVRRCQSFNADTTLAVTGDCGANPTSLPFGILDVSTGAEMTALAGQAGDGFDPEWSPDGASIAFSDRNEDLAITPVMSDGTFGASRVIHSAASSPGGAVDWHPTWTPNSAWIAYQHGETRRTHESTGGGVHGALWLISPDGGTPVRLDNANFGPDDGAGTNDGSYRPTFSPFDSGGYFWLLFTTLHDYGNGPAGVHGQKQVWVTAIRRAPDGTSDPSEVPYYLAGQEIATILSPQWVPPPCNPNGSSCSTSAECCSGECGPDDMCIPPPECRARGEACGGDDCCDGLVCTASHLCDFAGPD
ncbi:MAG: hypothetical protein AB7S26_35890 [Sandaracinaceae bacterium]